MARNATPDLTEFLGHQPPSGRPGLIEQLLARLDDDKRVKLLAALEHPTLSPDAIVKTLKAWGHPLSATTVHNYRKANGWR